MRSRYTTYIVFCLFLSFLHDAGRLDAAVVEPRAAREAGVAGFASQDASLQESMGPIVDRTKENLVGCDNGIIMARHKLMRAARALAEKGELPPGRDLEHQRIRSVAILLPRAVP